MKRNVRKTVRTYSANKKMVAVRRKRIVDAAKKLFYESGYHKTTMRELAKACGRTTGAIYYYIGSKEDILHLIAKAAGDTANELREYYAKMEDFDTVTALSACIRKYLEIANSDLNTFMFLNRELKHFEKRDRDYLLAMQVDIVDFFRELLERGVSEGKFQLQDSTLIGHDILMLGQDWIMRRWFFKKRYSLEEYADKEIDFLLSAIATSA